MPFFDQRSETFPRESLRELQGAKLAALLEGIFGRNRFYTDKMVSAGVTPGDIRSVEDLTRLPLTTKLELSQAATADPPFGTNVTFPEAAYTRIHQTSGTTGPPLKVLDTEESWDWWGRCWGTCWRVPVSPQRTGSSCRSPSGRSSASGGRSKEPDGSVR